MLREFAGLHQVLAEQAGVTVSLFQHSEAHGTPDAVFPNNWFSTHAAGEAAGGVTENTLVLYPMKCPNRCVFLPYVLLSHTHAWGCWQQRSLPRSGPSDDSIRPGLSGRCQ